MYQKRMIKELNVTRIKSNSLSIFKNQNVLTTYIHIMSMFILINCSINQGKKTKKKIEGGVEMEKE